VIIATGVCMLCGQPSSVDIADVRVAEKVKGYLHARGAFASVQQEFPMLTVGQRETLVSGSHEQCFDEAFKEDE
jgi:hypothetical protein